ncbi:hypothetical protein LC609_06255 [Nostoc sp. XA013]|nr:hypothetical protein [Nostoc sp. XA013]
MTTGRSCVALSEAMPQALRYAIGNWTIILTVFILPDSGRKHLLRLMLPVLFIIHLSTDLIQTRFYEQSRYKFIS